MTRIALATMLSLGIAAFTAPALAQEEGAPTEADGLSVLEMTLARGYEGGAAVDPSTTFRRADGRMFVVLQMSNTSGAEAEIRVAFRRADAEVGSGGGGATLTVAPRRTRTLARTGTGRPPGRYLVVIMSPSGRVLAQQEFEITE